MILAPSILAADLGHLADQIAAVERGGAGLVHVDVMDGRFVPNISLGPVVVEACRRATRLPVDVHLMIESAERYLDAFADAGRLLDQRPRRGAAPPAARARPPAQARREGRRRPQPVDAPRRARGDPARGGLRARDVGQPRLLVPEVPAREPRQDPAAPGGDPGARPLRPHPGGRRACTAATSAPSSRRAPRSSWPAPPRSPAATPRPRSGRLVEAAGLAGEGRRHRRRRVHRLARRGEPRWPTATRSSGSTASPTTTRGR